MLDPQVLKARLEQALAGATVEIRDTTGTGDHFEARRRPLRRVNEPQTERVVGEPMEPPRGAPFERERVARVVDRVDREHERIVVTRNGRPAAVLISPDDLESLEETLELLGDHDAIRELVQAEAAVASGDVVRGVDAVRALRTSPPS